MALSYQAGGRVHDAPVQTLLGQVFGITGIGLLVTAVAAYLFQNIALGFAPGIVIFLVSLGLLFAINAIRENEFLALALYYIYTFLMGIWIAPVIGSYVRSIGPDVVYEAAITTGAGMLGLAVIVYATGIDFRRFSGVAFGALLALVLVGIISAFTHWVHPTLYAWLTLGVFALLTLIDFSRIRAGSNGYTPVQMAVQIYLDALNIFLALLQIFGGRRSND